MKVKNKELLNNSFVAEELQRDSVLLSLVSSSGNNTRRMLSSFRFLQSASFVIVFSKKNINILRQIG